MIAHKLMHPDSRYTWCGAYPSSDRCHASDVGWRCETDRCSRCSDEIERAGSYVPRHYRPERDEAVAAIARYLEANPDQRIGQALTNMVGTKDLYQAEDADIIACEP